MKQPLDPAQLSIFLELPTFAFAAFCPHFAKITVGSNLATKKLFVEIWPLTLRLIERSHAVQKRIALNSKVSCGSETIQRMVATSCKFVPYLQVCFEATQEQKYLSGTESLCGSKGKGLSRNIVKQGCRAQTSQDEIRQGFTL